MVVLKNLPDAATIRSYKGLVDFYNWKGLSVARGWPRRPRTPRAPKVRIQQEWLKQANAEWSTCHPSIKTGFSIAALRTVWTARDLFMKYYFGTIQRHPLESPRREVHATPYAPSDYPTHYWAVLDWDAFLVHDRWLFLSAFTRTGVWLTMTAYYERPRTWFTVENDRGRILRKGPFHSRPQGERPKVYSGATAHNATHWLWDLSDGPLFGSFYFQLTGDGVPSPDPVGRPGGGGGVPSSLELTGPLGLTGGARRVAMENTPAFSPWWHWTPEVTIAGSVRGSQAVVTPLMIPHEREPVTDDFFTLPSVTPPYQPEELPGETALPLS